MTSTASLSVHANHLNVQHSVFQYYVAYYLSLEFIMPILAPAIVIAIITGRAAPAANVIAPPITAPNNAEPPFELISQRLLYILIPKSLFKDK